MSEYTLAVIDNSKRPAKVLCSEGPYYIESRAEYNAKKVSREYGSPDVVVMLTVYPKRRGFPKLYRMGRLHRQ